MTNEAIQQIANALENVVRLQGVQGVLAHLDAFIALRAAIAAANALKAEEETNAS